MPTHIPELLLERQVALDLSATSHAEALREMVTLFRANPLVTDLDGLHGALLERERQGSTAAGSGVAFPHARTDLVKSIVLAAGRSRAGISFGSAPGRVHLIFVIATPKALVTEYLVCVGALARLVQDTGTHQRLLAAETAADFVKCLA